MSLGWLNGALAGLSTRNCLSFQKLRVLALESTMVIMLGQR
jgi:hypothetical protein